MSASLAFPYRITAAGDTATSAGDAHVREMLEQLLFTSPGERVNHPTFGCGLLELVFEPIADRASAGVGAVVRAAVEQWLGDVIEPVDVRVGGLATIGASGSGLAISVSYLVRDDAQPVTEVFTVVTQP